MFQRLTKEEARVQLAALVEKFRKVERQITSPNTKFNEAETRTQYIDEFLRIFGWDVANAQGKAEHLVDVVLERSQISGDNGWGRPDYILRVGGNNRLPIEAKKASVKFERNAEIASQARSYGWTLSLPGAVLTNFAETRLFDTRQGQPDDADADFSLIPGCVWRYTDYIDDFDTLWAYLSYESVSGDVFEDKYGCVQAHRGQSSFDQSFLATFRDWRVRLANDLKRSSPDMQEFDLSQRVQKILNALLFMRVCEDRNILEYSELLQSAEKSEIERVFSTKDRIFNAGIFRALDGVAFSSDFLLEIVREMYWPNTKFAYSLINADMLARIYEQYLAEQIEFDTSENVILVEKPEVAHSGGVARTPEPIVNSIVSEALEDCFLNGKAAPRILDFAVGSGVFLLEALRQLVNKAVSEGHINSLDLRSRIVQNQLFGVDIDGAAIEVARLSLLLEILGDEKIDTNTSRELLPDISSNLGLCNSVVREDFDDFFPQVGEDLELRARIMPSNIFEELNFPAGEKFDAVIGNPPYVRIQVLNDYHPEQLAYFQHKESKYVSPQGGNFDLSMVFLERALELISNRGTVVTVVPNRFFTNTAAVKLREKLLPGLRKILDFGVNQVFDSKTTYVCILKISSEPSKKLYVTKVDSYESWVADSAKFEPMSVSKVNLSASRWSFIDSADSMLFATMRNASSRTLNDVASVFVGVQTSKDDVYFVKPLSESGEKLRTVQAFDGTNWEIENELLREAIRDASIDSYDGQPIPDCLAIFPYVMETNKQRVRAVPICAEVMAKNYPKALEYFQHFQDLLESRSVSPDPGDAFWAYGRSQSLTKLSDPKIVVRVLSIRPSYALDEQGLVIPGGGDGGPYYLIRSTDTEIFDNNVLQAVLCHPAVDRYIVENGKKYRGAYAVHKKSELVGVPLPYLTVDDAILIRSEMAEIRSLTELLRGPLDDRKAKAAASRRSFKIKKVENQISKGYGIIQMDAE